MTPQWEKALSLMPCHHANSERAIRHKQNVVREIVTENISLDLLREQICLNVCSRDDLCMPLCLGARTIHLVDPWLHTHGNRQSVLALAEEITGAPIRPDTAACFSFCFPFNFFQGEELVTVSCIGDPYIANPEPEETSYHPPDALGLILAWRPLRVRLYADSLLLQSLVPRGYVVTSIHSQCLSLWENDAAEMELEALADSYQQWLSFLSTLYEAEGEYRYIALTQQVDPWRGSFLQKIISS
jgi:hypothetical protein